MADLLKILMLEDNPDDAAIIQRLLQKEKLSCEFSLAMTKAVFLQELERFRPDIILADNSLPQFDAKDALQIARQRPGDIPFILVTGTVSEEFAAGIIKAGADDYVLKDRLKRLPAAIETAIKQHRVKKENQEAMESIRRSNERFQTISRATKDALWDWDLVTDNMWWNENFFILLGYDPTLPVPDRTEWISRIHPDERDKVITRLKNIKENTANSWEDELRILLPDGSYGTILDRVYILRDDSGKAVRVIGVFVDITEQKKLIAERRKMEEERLASRLEQQKEITRVILQTQEMERNTLGRELHDNINQILASVNLKLGYYLDEPENNMDIIETCRQSLDKAIQEARNLSHHMVIPHFSEKDLKDELGQLIENYSYKQLVQLDTTSMKEEFLSPPIKETLFRIVQEQLSNIYKHAKASSIMIRLSTARRSVTLLIIDNGVGFDVQQKRKGIGITNIFNRVESYNGKADIISYPGRGCSLSVTIPLPEKVQGLP
jgi:two-component system sensor histidine kinase UhpB